MAMDDLPQGSPEQIHIWETDPGSPSVITVNRPEIAQHPFAFSFPPPGLDPSTDTATPNFRYWNAAAALRRGTDFWGPALGANAEWFTGPILEVRLDVGVRWNSAYDRRALNFFRGELTPGQFIYASDSADLLCHELGHAILDIAQEQLWDSGNDEAAAFHESFGDVSAILCALQLPSIRQSVVNQTGGTIFADTSLSRIAEQFGTAMHASIPEDAEADCLRNAHNDFRYAPLQSLPTSGAAALLKSSAHSFSRVFTGAMFRILARLAALGAPATADSLHDATFALRDVMIKAAKSAPLATQYYASVAAKMMLEAREISEAHGMVFKEVFVDRQILSSESANAIWDSASPQEDTGFAGEVAENVTIHSPVAAQVFGLTASIEVAMPADPATTIARSASEGQSLAPLSAEDAAIAHVNGLFARGLVDLREADELPGDIARVRPTHRIERIDQQHLRLIRV